jgi:hypothetical protein
MEIIFHVAAPQNKNAADLSDAIRQIRGVLLFFPAQLMN